MISLGIRVSKNVSWYLSQDETLKRTYSRHDREDTESTASTVAVGLDGERLLEVRPYAHIPGKRKAPKVPPDFAGAENNQSNVPQAIQIPADQLGAVALEISNGNKPSVANIHSGLNEKEGNNKEQVKVKLDMPATEPVLKAEPAKLVKQARPERPKEIIFKRPTDLEIPVKSEPEKPVLNGFPSDFYAERFEVQSPKPWYKKNPFNFDKVIAPKLENQDSGQSMILDSPIFTFFSLEFKLYIWVINCF